MRLEKELVPGFDVYALVLLLLATPVEFFCGYRFHVKAYKTFRNGHIGMDFLISIGVCGCAVGSALSCPELTDKLLLLVLSLSHVRPCAACSAGTLSAYCYSLIGIARGVAV